MSDQELVVALAITLAGLYFVGRLLIWFFVMMAELISDEVWWWLSTWNDHSDENH